MDMDNSVTACNTCPDSWSYLDPEMESATLWGEWANSMEVLCAASVVPTFEEEAIILLDLWQ